MSVELDDDDDVDDGFRVYRQQFFTSQYSSITRESRTRRFLPLIVASLCFIDVALNNAIGCLAQHKQVQPHNSIFVSPRKRASSSKIII